MSATCVSNPTVYKPRKPEKTDFFKIVRKNLNTWKREHSNDFIPFHVGKAFESYLKCGILNHGFARAYCDSCQSDFLIAFSCKGKVCPSCNARYMVQTAAHIIESVIPKIPIRQWVISFPKRIRYHLKDEKIVQEVLDIVAQEIQNRLILCSPEISNPQFGAISFIQRFGSTLNYHPHFHLCISDGVLGDEGKQFSEAFLTPDDVQDTEDRIRERILKLFGKRGWIEKAQTDEMINWENSGFSLNADVRIEAWDRKGLERLIRYCARPSFASENLRCYKYWVVYRLTKPTYRGVTSINLSPVEFLDRVAALIPPPHKHRHHYHGVFAPNAPMRRHVTACANKPLDQPNKQLSKSTRIKVRRAFRNQKYEI